MINRTIVNCNIIEFISCFLYGLRKFLYFSLCMAWENIVVKMIIISHLKVLVPISAYALHCYRLFVIR